MLTMEVYEEQHIPLFTDDSKQSDHTATAVVLISYYYQTTSQLSFHIHG